MTEDDYEAIRRKNIAERNAIFAELFGELKKQGTDTKSLKNYRPNESNEDAENQPPKKRRRTLSNDVKSYRRDTEQLQFRRKYNTRSRLKSRVSLGAEGRSLTDREADDAQPKANGAKLRVLFPWAKPIQRSIDLMKMGVCDVDEEEEEEEELRKRGQEEEAEEDYDYDLDIDADYGRKRRYVRVAKSEYDPASIPSVDEITEDMLENIAERSSSKQYCKVSGTCCHQCRQKTLDTKTVCRSGECIGVRGQFCGPCLKGRYGESALEALRDPNWACPPCRGLCNCSICRTRSGLAPTGILAPAAQQEGFTSVMDYLKSVELNDD